MIDKNKFMNMPDSIENSFEDWKGVESLGVRVWEGLGMFEGVAW